MVTYVEIVLKGERVMIKVELIANTPNPEEVIATAAKLCYSPTDINTLREGLTPEKSAEFVEKLMNMGHESPIEHVSFTFAIEGISRACSHQLVRHRIASYSQQSQRYVNMNNFDYITPPAILSDEKANNIYQELIKQISNGYNELADRLTTIHAANLMEHEGLDCEKAIGKAKKLANEDARYILPNACETKIIVTMNARSLYNFFAHRCCNRAQWEIQEVAEQMYRIVYKIAPTLFSHAGASCVVNNRCPEGAMSCGHMRDMQERYKRIRTECRKDDSND